RRRTRDARSTSSSARTRRSPGACATSTMPVRAPSRRAFASSIRRDRSRRCAPSSRRSWRRCEAGVRMSSARSRGARDAREPAGDDDPRDDARETDSMRAPMPRLPWLDRPLRALAAQRATLAHALLVTGAAGTGKRNFAMHFAQALLCETPRDDGLACDTCASCVYFIAGQHPDFRLITFDTPGDDGEVKHRAEIPVDDIRALRGLV